MNTTPDLSHLTKTHFEHVYEPVEDTFLLLDALKKDEDELRVLSPLICLEIGSGSGIVSSFIGNLLGQSTALFLCTDINPLASRTTSMTGQKNNVHLESINTSLIDSLLPRLQNSVDILLFNPPYVPTSSIEVTQAQSRANIESSWAGGIEGMEITNLLLPFVSVLLSAKGTFFLVGVKQNNIPRVRQRMLDSYNLRSEIIIERRAGREHLFVIKFQRQKGEVRLIESSGY